jgi:hypothetical protein
MRPILNGLSRSDIQGALDELSRAVTSLMDSRTSGLTVARTDDISKPATGRIGYNAATGKLARFSGETWVDL